MTNNEADILSKYQDVFPQEFIESVRKGVSWLCTHNNITYQTSIMVASDRVLYNTAGTSVLRIGLINTDLPLTGLTYYEVKSIEVTKDEVSGSTVFNVKMKYNTPMGLTITLVPIIYFDPEVAPELYTKDEIDSKIKELTDLIDAKADGNAVNEIISDIYGKIKESVDPESVTKLETKVDDMLQSLALDFVTNDKLDEKLANVGTGGTTVDLTSYLKVKDAEDKYATKESVTQVDTKVQAIDLSTKADKTELANYTNTADMNAAIKVVDDKFANYELSTKVDEKIEAAKTEVTTKVTEVEGKVDAIQVPSVDGLATTEYVDNKVKEVQAGSVDKDEVVAALKADEAFKESVKGDKGDVADVSTLATKAELADYLKSETAETTYAKSTDLDSKANTTDLDAKLDKSTYDTDKAKFVTDDNKADKLSDYLTVTAADEKYQTKTA